MSPRQLLASLCLTLSLGVHASDAPVLNISVGDWPPYLSAELEHNGVVAHLISDILADEGYQVRFSFLPWPRAYAAAAAGKFDASAVWMRKDEREKDFLYSEPVLEEQFVFFHLKSLPFDWHRFDDLTGMTLGGGLEYSYGPDFDAFLASDKVTMERVSTDTQNFEKLLKERVVLYPQEVNVGYYALMRHFSTADIAKITHHPSPLLNNLSYLMLPRSLVGSPELLERFNRRLLEYRKSGRYAQYFKNFQQGAYFKATPTVP